MRRFLCGAKNKTVYSYAICPAEYNVGGGGIVMIGLPQGGLTMSTHPAYSDADTVILYENISSWTGWTKLY